MKTNYSSVKLIILGALCLLSFSSITSFAANPSFNLSPAELTGKLHCNYIFNMTVNPNGIAYNSFQSTIKFNSGSVVINHISINSPLNNFAGYSNSGSLYKAYGNTPAGQSSTATLPILTFGFKTVLNLTSTTLLLTDKNGSTIVFDTESTDDGAVIGGFVSSKDILTGITNGTYTFVPLPCVVDTNAPTMLSNNPSNGATKVPSNYTISFVLYDWVGASSVVGSLPLGTNNTSHYRYSGLNTTLSNYQAAPITVDNQEGVNSGTIGVTLSCPTCMGGSWPYTLTPSNLTMTNRSGDNNSNRYTRNSKTRGYLVTFPSPAPYEIEKLVTVNISVTDNPNENLQTHTGTPSFSFNAPQAPTITRTTPAGNTNISTTLSPIVFQFTDDRAGINTGTIKISIPQYSSGSKFYTGYTYSGSDLTITLISGAPGTGNSGSYQVSFPPKRHFPSNVLITITGSVYDLAGNIGTYTSSFTTAMSCADWGCSDIFQLNILGGINAHNHFFTGSLIVVTGTNLNSPYPYLTGVNNDILMCGRPYSGTILTGNIGIYDTTGVQINGILYTGTDLYITGMDGLDFVLSGGVVIIQ